MSNICIFHSYANNPKFLYFFDGIGRCFYQCDQSLAYILHMYLFIFSDTADWCRYKFYVSSIGWAEAFNQCEQNNQSLARITGASEHNLVASLVASSMSEMAGMYTVQ